MGRLSGETDTWLPGLARKNFCTIKKALFRQGFFVINQLYVAVNKPKLPGVIVAPGLFRDWLVPKCCDRGCYGPAPGFCGHGC